MESRSAQDRVVMIEGTLDIAETVRVAVRDRRHQPLWLQLWCARHASWFAGF
jgi:hypothetical protein